MKINNKPLGDAAEVSSSKGKSWSEAGKLFAGAVILVVAIYLVIALVIDLAVSRISFAREAQWAKALPFPWQQNEKPDPNVAQAQEVLNKLISDPTVPPLPYRLTVIANEDDLNAFAFPGGTIGLTQGLLEALDDEIALAFVLGHELGHFQHRDHLRGIGRSIGVGAAYTLLFGGQMGSDTLGHLFTFILNRGYSRHQEELADLYGIDLVFRVYGQTEGVDRLFQLLDGKKELPIWGYMFATHPSPRQRIKSLKAHADELTKDEK